MPPLYGKHASNVQRRRHILSADWALTLSPRMWLPTDCVCMTGVASRFYFGEFIAPFQLTSPSTGCLAHIRGLPERVGIPPDEAGEPESTLAGLLEWRWVAADRRHGSRCRWRIINATVNEAEPAHAATGSGAANHTVHNNEDEPMLYCPVCSTRLTERKCKLICKTCGYYLSCADYY